MTIHVTCDSCFMNYQLKDELAGRKVRCKHCQSIIEVPRVGKPTIEAEDDHWFDEPDEPADAPAPVRRKKKGKKKRLREREGSSGFRLGIVAVIGMAFVGLFVLMCLVGIVWRPLWSVLGMGTAVVGGGLALVGGIGILMAAFEEDTICGVMYLVVPFYGLYYIVTRIAEVWKLVLMNIGGAVLLVVGMMLLAMSQGREAGQGGGGLDFSLEDPQDDDSRENLKQMGLAMHNHIDAHRRFPPSATATSGGQVNVSWQTALLPFIDQAALYNQINPAVGWDDPANDPFNRKLIDAYM
jgi:ribosomal protein S27E